MKTKVYAPLQKAILLFCIFVSPVFAQAQCYNGWQYTMPVYITNSSSVNLDSFQVSFYANTAALVTAGHMRADGADIRFVDNPACCNVIPYFIDSGMNSTTTKIWVKLKHIAAGATDTITMVYGNASATPGQNPDAVFDFWEGFDSSTTKFTNICNDGSGTLTVAGGQGTFSWSQDALWGSDSIFQLNHIYTAEANVTALNGSWPGITWVKTTSTHVYSLLMSYYGSPGTFLVGPLAYDYGYGACNPVWLYNSNYYSGTGQGVWSFTWQATGEQLVNYDQAGAFPVYDINETKDEPLQFALGSIDGGIGSYTVDWARVRKYADTMPTATFDAEIGSVGANISYTTPICKNPATTDAPTFSGIAGGTYSMNPAGGSINATTGVINLTASAAGTYTVSYSYTEGACSNIAISVVTINAAPIPTLTTNGTILQAGGPFASYQWYQNGTAIPGATTTPYVATTGGSFYCIITDANGCVASSDTIEFHPAGVPNLAPFVDALTMYPNPNNGTFSLSGAAQADDNKATIEVMDITGKVLYKDNVAIVNSTIHKDVELGKIPAGIYMVRVSAGNEKKTLRLQVQ